MTTWAALLRGINVGKAKRLAMADLRALVEDAGYTAPRTLLNSGNVVFEGPRAKPERVAAALERAIEARAGFHSRVVVLDEATMATIVREQCLRQADDPSRLLVAFVQDRDTLAGARDVAGRDWAPEAMHVGTHAAYVWMPSGILESRAFAALGRVLGTQVTTRNWSTTTKLLDMMRA